ncbi:MAG: hypothetical protein QGI21_04775 [Candidatus Poseidoniaceae archaeon]|jgi:hypothetical protein|nr:hypothetical protein [Candidatus Poseidoniaceae archaeon]
MTDMTHLAIAYIGMIAALGIWTWTIMSRSNSLEDRIAALEGAIAPKDEAK